MNWSFRDADGRNHEVQITQMEVRNGRPVLQRIVSLFPAKLPRMEGKEGFEEAIAEFGIGFLKAAMADMDYFCKVFGDYSLVDGVKPLTLDIQDEVFADNYAALVQWVWECVQLNFGSLGGLLPSGGKEFAAEMVKAAKAKMVGEQSASPKA